MTRKKNGGLWGGNLRNEKREQYAGEGEQVEPVAPPSHYDDGTQLTPKLSSYQPKTKAERRKWQKERDAK